MKGQKNRRDLKLCSDKAMSLLEKEGVVTISKVANELNMAEDRTKLILDRAQKEIGSLLESKLSINLLI